MKLLSNEERAPSNRLRTKEMGTFLGGTKFSIETDHKALSFLHNAKSHMVRVTRDRDFSGCSGRGFRSLNN